MPRKADEVIKDRIDLEESFERRIGYAGPSGWGHQYSANLAMVRGSALANREEILKRVNARRSSAHTEPEEHRPFELAIEIIDHNHDRNQV